MPLQQPMRDGDIYFWRYTAARNSEIRKYRHDPYWCQSMKAVARNGLLIDTYWSDRSSEHAVNPEEVTLEYQGNESDLRKINHWEAAYYEPEDVVDMRHANNMRALVYVKPDAKRSQARILEHLQSVRAKEESAIRCAQWSIESIDAQIAEVNAGVLDKVTQ